MSFMFDPNSIENPAEIDALIAQLSERKQALLSDFSRTFVSQIEKVCREYDQPVVMDPTTGEQGVSWHSVSRVLPGLNLSRADWPKLHAYVATEEPGFFTVSSLPKKDLQGAS